MAKPTGRDVRAEVLVEARRAIQANGVSGFSYRDLAKEVGIRPPSIHHHFRRKEDLVTDVSAIYRAEFRELAEALDAGTGETVEDVLLAYAGLFRATAAKDLLCLCGALAADWAEAGAGARSEVSAFFDVEISWLADKVREGVASGEFIASLNPQKFSEAFMSGLEGALLLARTTGDCAVITDVATTMLHLAGSPGNKLSEQVAT